MLLWALIVIVCTILLVYANRDCMDSWMTGFFGAVIGFALGFMITMVIGVMLPTHLVANETVYLGNLYDRPEINGHFFLGSGHIDTTEVLHYSYYDEDDFRRFAHVDKESARVKEDDPEIPYLITYRNKFTQKWMGLIAINIRGDKDINPEFHIPLGTVDNEYDIK